MRAEIGVLLETQVTEDEDKTPDPTPSPVRVGRLNSLRNVRRELARLYADLRNARVDAKVAGTGAYILTAITKTIEVGLLEERVEVLEENVRFVKHAEPARRSLNG